MPETVHTHISPRFRVHHWMGNLVYRHSARYHAKAKIPLAPEPVGHLSHVAGTITAPVEFKISPQMPRENGDSPIPNFLYEAETLKPGEDIGQAGRAVLDLAASQIVKPVDTPGTTVATNLLWRKYKVFGGGRGLKGL